MAVYKVIQDVEAEDKFLGPLTFKQFLLGGGAGIAGYLIFYFITREIWFMVALLLPVFLFFAILAFPWSKDQPTELWLAARIRFLLVPRTRIWDQSGAKDLVQITVPKREVHIYSDGLNQEQVRSRLNALASVVDTRGWAVKNLSTSTTNNVDSDRLIVGTSQAPSESDAILSSTVDIMDEQVNPVAKQFTSMIQQSEDKHREETLAMIQAARQQRDTGPTLPPVAQHSLAPQSNDWVTQEQQNSKVPSLTSFQGAPVVSPGMNENASRIGISTPLSTTPDINEEQILEQVHRKKKRDAEFLKHSHQKVIKPLSEQMDSDTSEAEVSEFAPASTLPPAMAPQTPSTTPVNPAILALADNDDLNVETLARQAKRDLPDNGEEVIISLH